MEMLIARSLLAKIVAHAQSVPDREVCGLLFGDEGTIAQALPTANVHPDPARHYEVDPAALLAVHKADRAGSEGAAEERLESDRVEKEGTAVERAGPGEAGAGLTVPDGIGAARNGAARAGRARLIGAYHSHPSGDATPSAEDVASAEPGRLCLIVGGGVARLYRAEPGRFAPVKLVVTPAP